MGRSGEGTNKYVACASARVLFNERGLERYSVMSAYRLLSCRVENHNEQFYGYRTGAFALNSAENLALELSQASQVLA